MREIKLYKKEELLNDLKTIGSRVPRAITIYLIGGCAMSLKHLKEFTKDVDIIFISIDDLRLVEKELITIGYEKRVRVEPIYEKLGAYSILRHTERAGFDLFHIKVCNMLVLSEDMKKRAVKYDDLDKLSVYLLSNEDITLFKAITERPRDIEDISLLIKEAQKTGKFDWNVIKEECETQTEHLKIEGHLYNRLQELLERHQIRAPILSWLKNRDKRHLLKEAYETRLEKGFTHEQIIEQFEKEGFSKVDIAILKGFEKK